MKKLILALALATLAAPVLADDAAIIVIGTTSPVTVSTVTDATSDAAAPNPLATDKK